MQRIILANIGNRNITYKGLSYPDQKESLPGVSFRAFTEQLLLNFEVDKEHIQPAILPTLFGTIDIYSVEKLLLFYSDIQGGERNDQDTIYESLILEKIFSQKFPHLQIERRGIYCSVVDNNGLMKAYRNHLLEILENNPESYFIVCDAGGTAQQKAALKILVEFLIPKDQFETYNVLLNGSQPVEKVSSEEYRKVINQEQIRSLIQRYNYEAALGIYGTHAGENDLLQSFLDVTKLLFSNEIKAALSKAGLPLTRVHNDMSTVRVKGNYYTQLPRWESLLKKEPHFKLCLLLDIAACYHKRADKGFTILYNHIFLERFCSEIINHHLQGKNVDEAAGWQWLKQKLITKEKFPDFIAPYKLDDTTYASMPVKLALVKSLDNQQVNAVLDVLPSNQQMTFSNLRNKFAHEGKSISDDNITLFLPAFMMWRQLFDLPETETVFDNLNQSIIMMLK